ncbi:hypothetical protein LSUE1_G006955 [Lachnellula suecica]|uniref:Uncharacterized protein n=1 Tax=Lachnellula suecica TaxID=602035 RepID=A0A8T9C2U3_9HELO|nr:hypothetical protein LSUE1_G006955 [Lachnellula suecica]
MYFSISPSAPSTSYSTSSPMDIPSSGTKSSPSCAFPSWPRRSSLSSNSSSDEEYHNHSFVISDEELFPCVFDDVEQDITPLATPSSNASRSPASPMREQHIVVDHGTLMRELIAEEKAKMERRERRRRRSGSSKKSRSGSGSSKHMSPIQEAGE